LPTRHLSAGEVLRFRDHAFAAYFSDPAYLGLVREKFGEATVAHVREMVAQPPHGVGLLGGGCVHRR